jgi:hypothetical protein
LKTFFQDSELTFMLATYKIPVELALDNKTDMFWCSLAVSDYWECGVKLLDWGDYSLSLRVGGKTDDKSMQQLRFILCFKR